MDFISSVLDEIRVQAPLLSQFAIANGTRLDMQTASGAPFHYVISGEVELRAGECTYVLSAGDVALLPRWDQYFLQVGDGGRVCSIIDVVDQLGLPPWSEVEGLDVPLSFEIGPPPHAVQLLSGIIGINPREVGLDALEFPSVIVFRRDDEDLAVTVKATFSLVMRELAQNAPGFSVVSARALELFCAQALRQWLLRTDRRTGLVGAVKQPKLRKVLEAMHARPGERWNLPRLAQIAGQSRSTFAQEFAETLGQTPFAYLRQLRMRKAAVLIRENKKSVAEIALDLGYKSTVAFVKAFKLEIGDTPAKYRKNH